MAHSLSLPTRARLAARFSRRLAGAAVRGRWRQPSFADDRENLRRLLFAAAAEKAECPLCGYRGAFFHHAGRPRQVCPSCGSRSRHRVLRLALERWLGEHEVDSFEHCLHLAPEACLESLFQRLCRRRTTADLEPGGVGVALDLCALPFPGESFDFVFASHVLEHIVDDRRALAECWRVLRPGGLAILIVPITAPSTEEFGFADARRNDHARECGTDYFERYSQAGFELETLTGDQVGDVERHSLETWTAGGRTRHHIPFCRKPR